MAGHIQSTGLPQLLRQQGDVLGGGIIDPGLLHHERLPAGCRLRLAGCLHQQQPHQVGAIEAAMAETDANGGSGEQGWRRERLRQHRHQRQASGGGEFAFRQRWLVPQRQLMGPRQLQHRRNRNGQKAVGGLHTAAAGRWWRTADLLGSEVIHRRTHAHHIHKGIDRPHLMEMDGVRRTAVHGGLRFRQGGEHRQHPLAEAWVQGGLLDPRLDLAPVPVRRIRLQTGHREPASAQSTTALLAQIQPHQSLQADLGQRRLNHRHRHAEIKQCRQKHVAGQPGGAIDMESGGRR